jgi:hypothetical protein
VRRVSHRSGGATRKLTGTSNGPPGLTIDLSVASDT